MTAIEEIYGKTRKSLDHDHDRTLAFQHRNYTDRPVMRLNDATYEQGLQARFIQRITVIGPGETETVAIGRPAGARDGA